MNAGTANRWRTTPVWTVLAAMLATGVLLVAFRGLDLDRFLAVLGRADGTWMAVLVVAVPLEQVVRGWKWRQLLYDIRPIGALRLFGAVMAGYFANMAVPVGVSPLVRAWLVARLESLQVSTVLLTTAIERFIDGIVFSVLVMVLVLFAALPETDGNLRLALVVVGLGSLALFAGLIYGLFLAKSRVRRPDSLLGRGVIRAEKAFGGRLAGLGEGIAAGILWPASRARGAAVVVAGVVMKLVSATHFLWAGLAVGVLLPAFDYLFLLVFAGVSLIIARFIRIPGGFVIGSAFALKLLEVPDEEALAMVMSVHVASIATTIGVGALAMWRSGIVLSELRRSLGRDGG